MADVYYGGDEYTMIELPFKVEDAYYHCMVIAPEGKVREAVCAIADLAKETLDGSLGGNEY